MIHILIVTDHQVICKSIRLLNEKNIELKVSVEALDSAEEAANKIKFSWLAGNQDFLKLTEPSCLTDIIDKLISGRMQISSPILAPSTLLQRQTDKGGYMPFGLSDRELTVTALIVEGKTNKRIASELSLSVDTVKSHIKTIMAKLSVTDRTQAAVKAVRNGLI